MNSLFSEFLKESGGTFLEGGAIIQGSVFFVFWSSFTYKNIKNNKQVWLSEL